MNIEDLRNSFKKYLENPGNGPDEVLSKYIVEQISYFFKKIRDSHYWLYNSGELSIIKGQEIIEPVNFREEELLDKIFEILFTKGYIKYLAEAEKPSGYMQQIFYNEFNKQYKKMNPQIDELVEDIKFLLFKFDYVFIKQQEVEYILGEDIVLSPGFEIEKFESYQFSKNNPKKDRLKKTFFAMVAALSENKTLKINNLISELKNSLNIQETKVVPIPDLQGEDGVVNTEEFGDSKDVKEDEFLGNHEIEDSNTLVEPSLQGSSLYENFISSFLNECKNNHIKVFATDVLLSNYLHNYEIRKTLKLNKKDITRRYIYLKYDVKSQTYYNYINICKNKLNTQVKPELNSADYFEFLKLLKDRFSNLIKIDEEFLQNLIDDCKNTRKKKNDK